MVGYGLIEFRATLSYRFTDPAEVPARAAEVLSCPGSSTAFEGPAIGCAGTTAIGSAGTIAGALVRTC